jgi:ubiquinone/menaquinone biosynthesis C-methylase UbiE
VRRKPVDLRFKSDAEQIIREYVNEVNNKIDGLKFKVNRQLRRDLLFNIEHHLKYASFKHSQKRGAASVERKDVQHVLKKSATPEKLVKERLFNPKDFPSLKRLWLNRLSTIEARLKKSSEPWLLDAGCGWGRTLFELERHGINGEFVGVDTDKVSIKYGRFVSSVMHWVAADIQGTLPFRERSFDAIVCRAVLHETKENRGGEKAIREFARVLKPRGLLHLTDTFVKHRCLPFLLKALQRITRFERYYHLARVEAAVKQSGFKEVITKKILQKRVGDVYIITATLQ